MANLEGAKAFSALYAEVGDYTLQATPTTATKPTLARVKTIINDTYRELCSERNWAFLHGETTVATVASTAAVELSKACEKVIGMQIRASSLKLRFMTREQFQAQHPYGWTSVGNGIPLIYTPGTPATTSGTTTNALTFDLFPTPDAVYTINYAYKVRVTDLSSDTDVMLVPPEWQDVVISLAIAKVFRYLRLKDEAEEWEGKALKRKAKMWLWDEQQFDSIYTFRDPDAESAVDAPGLLHPYRF